jgi:hypothetical protein
VTAFDLDDAIALLDARTLDRGHVIPNMLAPGRRGVWYPMGYEPLAGR